MAVDTTPPYPDPGIDDTLSALSEAFPVFGYIAPGTPILASTLVRAVMALGLSAAKAMWALHELTRRKGLQVFDKRSIPDGFFGEGVLITDDDPPAGLAMASGKVQIDGGRNDWSDLIFLPIHNWIEHAKKEVLNESMNSLIKKLSAGKQQPPTAGPVIEQAEAVRANTAQESPEFEFNVANPPPRFSKPNPNDPADVLDWLSYAQAVLAQYVPDPQMDHRVHQLGCWAYELAGDMRNVPPTVRAEMERRPQPEERFSLTLGDASHNLKVLRQALIDLNATDADDDPNSDQQKKLKKRRLRAMTVAATDCVRLYKKAKKRDSTVKMQGIVEEYVDKHGGSVATILRCLSDNKEQWH